MPKDPRGTPDTSVTSPEATVIPLRGANQEDGRIQNLSFMLRQVHSSGGVSRAELTRISGLNRSTVSALIAELVGAGLVVEGEPLASASVGRPSLMVTAHPHVAALAFSPRRRAATMSAVGMSGHVIGSVTRSFKGLPDPYEMALIAREMQIDLSKQVPAGLRVAGIGADLPGQVNIDSGYVTYCEQLDWVDAPFVEFLQRTTGLPAYIDNNANLACAAERDFGAGRGFDDTVYLYGGEGGVIGGGVVIGGRLLRGAAGYAGELGHIRISDIRSEDTSGLRGTLEALVRREDLLAALRLKDVEDDDLNEILASSKNPRVLRVMQQQIDYLAIAISNLVNIFNPQAVLLAGFLSALYEADDYRLLSQIRAGSVTGARERVMIRTASLGSAGLAVGAAELAFAKLLRETTSFELMDLQAVI